MPGIASIQLFIHHCIISSQLFMHKFNFRYGVPYLDKPFKELLICSWIGCPYWLIKFVYLHVSRIKCVFRRKCSWAKLLTLPCHMVGQGPAVLAAAAGRVGFSFCIFFFISSILSSFFNASSVGRRLDVLKYCGLCRYNPAVVVSYYRRRAY